MTRILDLIPINPELPVKSALLADNGRVIYEGREYVDLHSFQEFLRKQDSKYMISDESTNRPD
jgi:hypothetical protein